MSKKIKVLFLVLFFSWLGFGFLFNRVSPIWAAEAGLTVSPPFLDVELNSNLSEQNLQVELKNNGDNPLHLSLSLVDFGPLDESGGVAFLGADFNNFNEWSANYGLAKWLNLEVNSLELAARGAATVQVTLLNKDSLSPGGHYAGLLVSEGEASGSATANVGLKQIISALFFVRKMGGAKPELLLNKNDLSDFYFWSLPDSLHLRFQNAGNIHLVPRGRLLLRDPLQRVVSMSLINPESSIILPSSFRQYPQTLLKQAQAFLPGRYTLTAEYRYDGNEVFNFYSASFFYLGWPVLLLFALLLLCSMVFWRFKKSQK